MAKISKIKNLTPEDVEDVFTYFEQADNRKPSEMLKRVTKFKAVNQSQSELNRLMQEKDIVIVTGAAGTGKTYGALWVALNMIKDASNNFKTISLTKSVRQIKEEELGYMPGDEKEKLAPVMYSFTGNINKICGTKIANDSLLRSGQIEWKPVAFLRGVQFDNTIAILDEAQNLSAHNIKTIITRLGKSSKLVIMGDLEQYDGKNIKESGFETIKEILKDSPYVGVIEFKDSECVRNPIITDIVKKLRKHDI